MFSAEECLYLSYQTANLIISGSTIGVNFNIIIAGANCLLSKFWEQGLCNLCSHNSY